MGPPSTQHPPKLYSDLDPAVAAISRLSLVQLLAAEDLQLMERDRGWWERERGLTTSLVRLSVMSNLLRHCSNYLCPSVCLSPHLSQCHRLYTVTVYYNLLASTVIQSRRIFHRPIVVVSCFMNGPSYCFHLSKVSCFAELLFLFY